MIGGEEHPDLVASWKAERRCFRWTIGFTAGLCVWVLGGWGAMFWLSHHLKSSLAKSGPITADQMGPIFLANAILSILIVISGFGMIISLIKWLLAIHDRRKMQMSVGFQAGEDL